MSCLFLSALRDHLLAARLVVTLELLGEGLSIPVLLQVGRVPPLQLKLEVLARLSVLGLQLLVKVLEAGVLLNEIILERLVLVFVLADLPCTLFKESLHIVAN